MIQKLLCPDTHTESSECTSIGFFEEAERKCDFVGCVCSWFSITDSSISVTSVPLEDGAIGEGSGISDGLDAGFGDEDGGGCSLSPLSPALAIIVQDQWVQ